MADPMSDPARPLESLVLDLQAHAREEGWQDADAPLAALLEWRPDAALLAHRAQLRELVKVVAEWQAATTAFRELEDWAQNDHYLAVVARCSSAREAVQAFDLAALKDAVLASGEGTHRAHLRDVFLAGVCARPTVDESGEILGWLFRPLDPIDPDRMSPREAEMAWEAYAAVLASGEGRRP